MQASCRPDVVCLLTVGVRLLWKPDSVSLRVTVMMKPSINGRHRETRTALLSSTDIASPRPLPEGGRRIVVADGLSGSAMLTRRQDFPSLTYEAPQYSQLICVALVKKLIPSVLGSQSLLAATGWSARSSNGSSGETPLSADMFCISSSLRNSAASASLG